jgi:hypothetical protein
MNYILMILPERGRNAEDAWAGLLPPGGMKRAGLWHNGLGLGGFRRDFFSFSRLIWFRFAFLQSSRAVQQNSEA